MTDNRDIDEILASLDALLREGDSHNDDMPAEAFDSGSDTDALEATLETDMVSIEPSVEGALSGDEVGENSVVAVFDGVIAQQEDSMSRVVLTEDMMVENPQVSLPLAFNSESVSEDDVPETLPLDDMFAGETVQQDVPADESVMDGGNESNNVMPEPVLSNQVMGLHKQEIEQLLARVSLDVSSHLQEMLPKLIEESLHAHLADMQHDSEKNLNENNKTSDDK